MRSDLQGALRSLEAALESDPRNAGGWCRLGVVRHAMGRPGARDAFDRALAIDPAHPEALQSRAFLSPARAADEDHLESPAQARIGLKQPGRGLEHHVGALERLHPADEEQYHRVRRDPETAPCHRRAARAARPEDAQVRARVDCLHLGRVRAVQRGQLVRLLGRVGDEPVRRGHHLKLAADPLVRLDGITRRERRVLHLAQGVHRLHERHPPAFLGSRADLA